ncbi:MULTISPECIES: IclR family transcriptional regulator C-terminal domain-containing protein [unclassified Chelatococcus]|uniref:IclR family transcriptional regulator n=1 Tax=unclassified Chelatococcus TaxID=2638111 RepID=UPI001BCD2C9A|nr:MULTISPECIES: IclR family transcriptional regulator C-terminal domain-containing protein [unclassified Chelatococcus]CAH1654804.1 conserved hypothetical protein [Hyphomicrobiales bacterium]MBS7742740.1 helix-turn-helix domain-containing protein [Chelatococcus sp. HY11]MBX3542142.1 helix-turn-helix domain-containing protein [Chelatococcus sp.]MCO5075643.1 helix-turn-helix domain-containing protein [Chelatococcus sp.]CAH1695075.1 conserved hypothetical protein [Hyphomicrobiales bacterium]
MADEGVKSARRVFEFLEYFAAVQRSVSVAELATHYGYPNSSVSSIMRTMVGMGYLSYNGSARTYLPTARLTFLVDWVATQLYDQERVRAIMQDLSDATGETILLGVQNGIQAQYVQIIDATGPVRLHAEPGSFRGLGTTAVGHILLARHDDAQISRLIRRINSDTPDPSKKLDPSALIEKVRKARAQGYALSISGVVKGAGAIAMLLPESLGATPLAIGISSVEAVIVGNEQAYVDLLRTTIQKRTVGAANWGEQT